LYKYTSSTHLGRGRKFQRGKAYEQGKRICLSICWSTTPCISRDRAHSNARFQPFACSKLIQFEKTTAKRKGPRSRPKRLIPVLFGSGSFVSHQIGSNILLLTWSLRLLWVQQASPKAPVNLLSEAISLEVFEANVGTCLFVGFVWSSVSEKTVRRPPGPSVRATFKMQNTMRLRRSNVPATTMKRRLQPLQTQCGDQINQTSTPVSGRSWPWSELFLRPKVSPQPAHSQSLLLSFSVGCLLHALLNDSLLLYTLCCYAALPCAALTLRCLTLRFLALEGLTLQCHSTMPHSRIFLLRDIGNFSTKFPLISRFVQNFLPFPYRPTNKLQRCQCTKCIDDTDGFYDWQFHVTELFASKALDWQCVTAQIAPVCA